jgi:hypothetical protein
MNSLIVNDIIQDFFALILIEVDGFEIGLILIALSEILNN